MDCKSTNDRRGIMKEINAKNKRSHFGNIVICIHLLRHDSLHLKHKQKQIPKETSFPKARVKEFFSFGTGIAQSETTLSELYNLNLD
jgi:hypothetical protein